MSLFRSGLIVSVSTLLLASACSSNPATNNDGGTNDGGTPDSGTPDAGPDGGLDAGPDAGFDAGPPPPPGDGGSPAAAPILSFTTSLTGVQLSWTLPGALGGEQFQVLRSDANGGFQPVANAQSLTADSYSDLLASAAPGAGHQYEVTANNGNGLSPPSNIVDVLQAPGDVVAGGSDTRVLLFWSALSNAASYDVYRVPAADAGSPTKMGNVTLSEFVDDGSTLSIDAGSSYSYQVVAQPLDGGQPSTGSNTATAKALGIDITDVVTHVSDLDAGVTGPENLTEGVFAYTLNAGAFTAVEPFAISTASILPGIAPNATWYFTYGDGTFLTPETARSIDIGGPVAGRIDALEPINLPAQTVMAYDLLGLSAFTEVSDGGLSDTLQSVSVGAGNFVTGLEFALDDGGITAGATTFVGNESIVGHFIDGGTFGDAGSLDYFDNSKDDIHLVDSTKGDQYYVTQLHQATTVSGHVYQAVAKSYADLTLVEADGHTNPINATLATTAPSAIADLKVLASQFVAQKAAVNPAATSAGQIVSILASKDFATYGHYTQSPTLLNVPVTASADTDYGPITYGNPFPASWQTFVSVTSTFDMSFDLTGDTKAATFASVSTFLQPAAGFDFTSIAPTLSPVTNLQINGKSAFSDEVNVTTSPTITWTAPAGPIAPSRYVVSQYELGLEGTTTKIGYYLSPELQDLTFTTTATSYKLPATLTTDSDGTTHWYFVTVDAIYEANGSTQVNALATPFHHGTTYFSSQVVSNKFTEGAGTKAPSHLPILTTRAPPHARKLEQLLHAAE